MQKLTQEGIHDAKVESSGNSVMIHFVSALKEKIVLFKIVFFCLQQEEDALIQIEDTCTHVLCNSNEQLRMKLRNIIMQCLKKF